MPRALILALALLPLLGYGQQIYKSTDANGNVVYSDQPPADGAEVQRIEVPQTNTTPAPAVIHRLPTEPATTEQQAVNYTISIISPTDETTIAMGPGNFSVSASVSPALAGDHSLQLKLDGANRGEPQKQANWQLTNVFRGAHDLSVALVNSAGEELGNSDPVRIYVLRPSIHNRNRN
jgi:Domain of unknown function (DUF4124)